MVEATVTKTIQSILLRVYKLAGKKCPECGTEMLVSKQNCIDTQKPMPPMCPACYYPMSADKIKDDKLSDITQLTAMGRKSDAEGYMIGNSIFSNRAITRSSFQNFNIDMPAQQAMRNQAEKAAQNVVDGEIVHAMFTGGAGVGKSHVAYSAMRMAVLRSGYNVRAFFLDWQEFLSISREAISDKNVAKRLDRIKSQFSKADLIILEDIGSERNTDFAADAMDRFWRNREDKSVIITTNLSPKDLTERYGDRVISRIKKHGHNQGFVAKGIPDQRQTPF